MKLKFKLELTDKDLSSLQDAKGSVKKVRVKIEATHSGIVNKNKFFYTPQGMSDGTQSFVEPYKKPVMVNHDNDISPIGRVLEARYIDYVQDSIHDHLASSVRDAKDPRYAVDTILDFIGSPVFNDSSYKGLGHVELVAEITDKEAIEKIIDNRYITVSIGGGVDKAICSTCGSDKLSDDSCDHMRGEVYDGETCFLIGGKMEFNEVSYVNSPADKNAVSEIISDSTDETIYSEQAFEILDFEIEDTGESKLKKKLQEILADKNVILDTLKTLGLESFALSDERQKRLRKTSFLFADEKALPVTDKAHIIAAYTILNDVEDSDNKAQALKVLDKKFENLFGKDISVEDATKALQEEVSAENVEDKTDETNDEAPLLDQEALATQLAETVVAQLKDSYKVSDSYLSQRNEALESEVTALEKELEELTDKYRSSIINQILAVENKTEDSDYASKLEARTLDSLHDKLDDLGYAVANNAEEDAGDVSDDAEDDAKDIEDADLNIEDAADDEGIVEDDNTGDNDGDIEDNVQQLTVKQVKDEYTKLIRSEGFGAASKYINDLRDNKQLPSNFTF